MPPRPARRFISASEFKARCLELMDEVGASRAELVITKHGTAVARLVPMADSVTSALGFLRGTVGNELSLFDSEVLVGAPFARHDAAAGLPRSKSRSSSTAMSSTAMSSAALSSTAMSSTAMSSTAMSSTALSNTAMPRTALSNTTLPKARRSKSSGRARSK